ncbi:MAG: FtsX-like permease family protein [Bdellovibrionota bacterium]
MNRNQKQLGSSERSSTSFLSKYLVLAFKNLRRRTMRTSLTAAGIALAVAVAVSLGGFILGYRNAITRSIEMLGYQVMIMAKGCPYEAATLMLKGGTGLIYLPSDVYDSVRSDPEIDVITPIFVGIAKKEGSSIRDEEVEKSFLIISGIDTPSFLRMKPWVSFKTGVGFDGGRWFTPDAEGEVVLGYEAAEYEQRKVGDTLYASITPAGSVDPVFKQFKVVGILERTGTQDDGTAFMSLPAAQKLFNRPTSLTILGIKLKEFNTVRMREFEGRWLKLPSVQVVSLQQVKTTLVNLVGTAQTMIAAVAIIAVVVAMIGVVNTILMSVYERTGEIGIMKAIGARRGDIFTLVWLETLVICAVGGIFGCLLAVIGSGAVEYAIRTLVDFGVQGSLVSITFAVVGYALLGAIVLGFFAGLYPAWRAASMRPVDAIREG